MVCIFMSKKRENPMLTFAHNHGKLTRLLLELKEGALDHILGVDTFDAHQVEHLRCQHNKYRNKVSLYIYYKPIHIAEIHTML
jgi:hypothetical protein